MLPQPPRLSSPRTVAPPNDGDHMEVDGDVEPTPTASESSTSTQQQRSASTPQKDSKSCFQASILYKILKAL